MFRAYRGNSPRTPPATGPICGLDGHFVAAETPNVTRPGLIQPEELLGDALRDLPFGGPISSLVSRLLGVDGINRLYASVASEAPGFAFFDGLLRSLNITVQVSACDLQRIPAAAALVAVANHPFGAIEGIILGSILARVRPDVRFMANFLLTRMPQMEATVFAVDPFGGERAKIHNLRGMRQAITWLKQGGALGVFPAGEVSHWNAGQRCVTDPPWNPNVARLIVQAGAATVPVFFDGTNGLPFHVAGMVHPRLRTVQLCNELLNKRNRTIEVRIGNPVPADYLREAGSNEQAIGLLRKRVYLLSNRRLEGRSLLPKALQPPFPLPLRHSVAEAQTDSVTWNAVAQLPSEQLLAEHGEFAVYVCTWDQAPEVVREIGRLRELTFREAGEGTGKPIDLDRFDRHYQHLFVYNRERGEVVGAYRVARVHDVVERFGLDGLYVATLFHLEPRFFRHLGKALELGRSFVRKEYQRAYAPLMLLWKGIGKLVLEDPSCTRLMGPVSISNAYSRSSRQIVVDTLQEHNAAAPSSLSALSQFVRPRRPFHTRRVPGWDQQWMRALLADLDGLSSLVAELEADGKGIPVLLRQYLKLGGRVLGFNVDPRFANALDGLIVVDLREADRRVLAKYLGKEGAKAIPEGIAAALENNGLEKNTEMVRGASA